MTVGDLIRDRAKEHPDRPFVSFEDMTLTYGEYFERCVRVANLLDAKVGAPRHVGVLMENRLEYLEVLGGAALCGAVVVGINATRRGPELQRDIRHTDCSIVIADEANAPLLEGLDLPEILTVGSTYDEALRAADATDARWTVEDADLFLLIFTSGTTGAPKAVRCSHARMIGTGTMVADLVELTADDCAYVTLPLFHSNPLMCGLLPTLIRGARMALAPRFSVSAFLPDVRRYGATYFPYSGKPLSFLLTPEEKPEDSENPLRISYGNEGSVRIVERFEKRYGVRVIDGFGPSEGAMGFPRRPGDPPGSVGKPPSNIKVLNEDGSPVPAALFGHDGKLLNPDECIGEIVNTEGVGRFEGYYNNPEAEERRVRDGMYWSGDLGYVDEDGFLYFAGRTEDWIRVDAENFPPHPIEEIIERHPDVLAAAAYGVPDETAGDRVMVALQPLPRRIVDPDDLFEFISSQPDMSPKWMPTYVVIAGELPRGVTGKILIRELRREKFLLDDPRGPVYWRERGETTYKPLTPDDEQAIQKRFAEAGREHLMQL
ncbi:MAG: AMP-binding protein [Actinomycetota bacterium]